MFTLKDFLNLNTMSDAKLLNKEVELSSFPVKYISVQEPPVEGFVRENEIVLSTTTALDCDDDLLTYVHDVYHSHAAALVFTFSPHSNLEMSQEIIDFADAHRFPLIEIPWEVRFSSIVDEVANALKEADALQESKYADLQKELLQLYFFDDTLEDAAELIAVITHHSIKILDKNKNEKAAYLFDTADEFHEIRIEVNNYLYGYVSISLEPFQEKETVDIDSLVFHINIPLSLWFVKEEVIHVTGLKIRNDYVWKLINEENGSDELINQGSQLGFDMDRSYFCVLLKIHPQDEDTETISSNTFMILEKKILALLKQENIKVMLGFKNQAFILFLEHQMELEADALLDRIEQALLSSGANYRFYWGMVEKTQSKKHFSEQYRMAKTALDQAIDLNITRLTFKQSRITSIINQITPRHKVRQQARDLLDPVLLNDRYNENGMDLIETVAVYLHTNLNTSETSRKLNIHRQSLLYRLAKFEEITTFSLENVDDLFLLQYYLRILGKFHL